MLFWDSWAADHCFQVESAGKTQSSEDEFYVEIFLRFWWHDEQVVKRAKQTFFYSWLIRCTDVLPEARR